MKSATAAGPRQLIGNPLALAGLLATVTFVAFWQVTRCEFSNYDDPDCFSANPHVLSGLSWPGVKWAFETTKLANWHPLTWLSFMADASIFGAGPRGPHLTNLLFHAANTVLLFLLLWRLTQARWKSAMAAGLFALHPLHVESVAWVAERKDMLSTFFGLLALYAYAKHVIQESESRTPNSETNRKSEPRTQGSGALRFTFPVSRFYFLSLSLFALSLMSKPMLVTLPFLMLLLDSWPLQRLSLPSFRDSATPLFRLILEKAPFFALTAIFCGVTFWAQKSSGAVAGLASLPWGARLENAIVSYARYLEKTFWPVKLAHFYPHPGHWPRIWVGLSLILVLGITIVTLRLARLGTGAPGQRQPWLLVGWFWFLLTLLPVVGLVQVGLQAMADRYSYVPLIGIFLAIVWGFGELARRYRVPSLAIACVCPILLLACALRTADQINHWRNSETLFRHTLQVTKNNYVAHTHLGWHLAETGRAAEAVDQFQEAIRIFPGFSDALDGLGYAQARLGLLDEAVASYHRAVELDARSAAAWNNLGFALFNKGSRVEAVDCYRRALNINPEYADAWNNLGYALAQQGHPEEAVAQFQTALRIDPRHIEARNNLGIVLDELGKLDEAIACYREVLARNPDHPNAHGNLGVALSRQGKLDEATVHFRAALRLRPGDPWTHNNLANVLALQNKTGEAMTQYEEALRLNPQYPEAHNNLASLLARLGRRDEAISHLKAALRLKPDYREAAEQLRALTPSTP